MAESVLPPSEAEARDRQTKSRVEVLKELIRGEIDREARSDARAWLDASPEERGTDAALHDGNFAADAAACFTDLLRAENDYPGSTCCVLLARRAARSIYVAAYLDEIGRAA